MNSFYINIGLMSSYMICYSYIMNETPNDNIMDIASSNTVFKCPNCGKVSQDDVIFLCNTCKSDELIEKDGLYICPSCLIPGENFECMLCGSQEVKMLTKIEDVQDPEKISSE